jgi:N-acetylglucosamine kinase-like BadF-type ATPase
MIQLIAESGSTKTSWYLIQEDQELCSTQTLGMNPYFTKKEELISELTTVASFLNDHLGSTREKLRTIHFYGAGYGNPATRRMLLKAFQEVFPGSSVQIETDLLAAARALFGNEPGIACIMGTGSNCGLYNGIDFIDRAPSLGFSLGDEGSAGFFGKWIVRDFYFKRLPTHIEDYVKTHFNMDINHTLDRTYRQKHGNAYIASFAQILATFREEDYIVDLIERAIQEFLTYQLGYFQDSSQRKVGMVGSVAFYHEERIRKILAKNGWDLVKVLQHPIHDLVAFHNQK